MKYTLHSECVPVKGINRGIIYDLNRNDYHIIPLNLTIFLTENKFFTSEDISSLRGKIYKKSYLKFLLELEIIHEILDSEMENFISIHNNFEVPYHISNTHIDLDFHVIKAVENIKEIIKKCLCFHVTIHVKSELSWENLNSFLNGLDELDLRSVTLILKDNLYSQINSFVEVLLERYRNLIEINLYSCNEEQGVFYFEVSGLSKKIIKSKNSYSSMKTSNQIKSSFIINRTLFHESLNFNNYYYKKMMILGNGEIYNSFKSKSFGNVSNYLIVENIVHIVNSEEFSRIGHVNKDKIVVCSDCEFRYMCIDDRTPILNKLENNWYFETECLYNPKTCEWYD